MRQKFTVNLKNDQLQTVFDDALKFSGETCTLSGFKHDVINVACLLQEDGLYTSFIHKSLLDYFPAAFIKNCTDEQSLRIYNAMASNWDQWQYVLNFLAYIDKYRFAKYFAIPNIQSSLNMLGKFSGKITNELVQKVIELTFKQDTHFSFKFVQQANQYRQQRFGPWNDSIKSYFIPNIHRLTYFTHKFQLLSKLDCKFTLEIEDSEERHLVYWKDLLTPEIVLSIEKEAESMLSDLYKQHPSYSLSICIDY